MFQFQNSLYHTNPQQKSTINFKQDIFENTI